jgi:hypothetical protein
MQITSDQWNEIVAETLQRIDKWNAHAAENKVSDTFRCDLKSEGEYAVLITAHGSGCSTDRKAVAYKTAANELKPVKLDIKQGRILGYWIKPDPKAWASLPDKPVAEIVKRLKLTDFLMITGTSVARPPSGPPLYLVHGFHRQDHKRRVAMVVAEEEGGLDAHETAERIAGPDFCFHASQNIGVLVPTEWQGVLFEGDEELYAVVPELRPRDLRRHRTKSAARP